MIMCDIYEIDLSILIHFEFPVLTGSKHFAHEIALHSGQTSRLYRMSAMKPDEH